MNRMKAFVIVLLLAVFGIVVEKQSVKSPSAGVGATPVPTCPYPSCPGQ